MTIKTMAHGWNHGVGLLLMLVVLVCVAGIVRVVMDMKTNNLNTGDITETNNTNSSNKLNKIIVAFFSVVLLGVLILCSPVSNHHYYNCSVNETTYGTFSGTEIHTSCGVFEISDTHGNPAAIDSRWNMTSDFFHRIISKNEVTKK